MKNLSFQFILLFLSLFFFSSGTLNARQETPDWENPQVFSRNQLAPHVTLIPFKSMGDALKQEEKESAYYQSLNGSWKFHWTKTPESAPADFYKMDFAAKTWDEIKVPGNWQMQGYGKAFYVGWGNPEAFKGLEPPDVPDDYNPVGSYLRTFTLPEDWNGRPVYLHFEGVKSAFYIWVNGERIGYNEGSMTSSEFDITPYIQEGENRIAVRVYRFSDGTYLEDQDMQRLSGIYRDVYLYSPSVSHIRDLEITTDLDHIYRDADLDISAEIKNMLNQTRTYRVKAHLYNANDEKVFSAFMNQEGTQVKSGGKAIISMKRKIENPRKWSAEKPHLYTLVLELIEPAGEVAEIVKETVGFREIEAEEGAILVNGKPVKFNGVNRHSWHPELGQAVTRSIMEKDLRLMKQFNINLVRTAHYPPDPEFLDLADRYGIYVVEEANQEATPDELSRNPEWRDAYVDRGIKMVERDKNHPSVIFWSAGNEGGFGENIQAIIEEGKKLDPAGRLWMYGEQKHKFTDKELEPYEQDADYEDITGPRYPNPENAIKVGEFNDQRPAFFDEYVHAMGNALSNFQNFWDIMRTHKRLTGGAVWDWVNQGIKRTTDSGEIYFDYGSSPFCANGILNSDRTPQPEIWQIKKTCQPVKLIPVDLKKGIVQVKNRYNFTSLDALDIHWNLVADGGLLHSGKLNLTLRPGKSRTVHIPFGKIPSIPGAEYWLNVDFTLPENTIWADKGHLVAWEQFRIPIDGKPLQGVNVNSLKPLNLKQEEGRSIIKGEDFTYIFSEKEGFVSMRYRGKEIMKNGPQPDFWSKILNNWSNKQPPEDWRKARLDSLVHKVENFGTMKESDRHIRVQVNRIVYTGNGDTFNCEYLYHVFGNGDVLMDVKVKPGDNLPETLPKMGMNIKLPEKFNQFSWYGRGPGETYPKRKTAARVGVYSETVEEQYYPFIVPQKHGNKTDTRWVTLSNRKGLGLMVSGEPTFNVSASRYSSENLTKADRTYKLKPAEHIILDVDHDISGTDARYHRVKTKDYQYSVIFRPFSVTEDSPFELHKRKIKY